MKRLLLIFCMLFFPSLPAGAAETAEPRVLIGLFDTREESTPRTSQIHRFLEMPANHLGFDIQYADVNAPLPALDSNVAGIVMWFNSGVEVPDAKIYMDWLETALKNGKKLIMIENAGIGVMHRRNANTVKQWSHILNTIGLNDDGSLNEITYHATINALDHDMVNFERSIGPVLPAISGSRVIPGDSESYLRVKLNGTDGESSLYDMVITSKMGGYIAPGYALFHSEDQGRADVSQWYVNPFRFLAASLDARLRPIPDVTTLNGRRIFYSHIDGDGWNNISEIPEYAQKNTLAAEVIYREVLKPYADFAFSVGLITADVEPECYGVEKSAQVAKEIFALPNVEPSSHTHTHPLFWQFFSHYDASAEKELLSRYPAKPKEAASIVESIRQSATSSVWDGVPKEQDAAAKAALPPVKRGRNEESQEDILRKYFDVPRSYACKPFDLEDEVRGSIDTINSLSPPDKKVKLIQWSGDTSPFEAAIAKAREHNLLNINGGDSRFDNEYPSYATVSPIGLKVGNERQIFSSNSNENTYTNLWRDRFFGYRYLQTTVRNTESPMRVRPFNIYFHIFSGQKAASLNAVKENLEFARQQELIAITASDYAAIANGFYSSLITRTGERSWHIVNRGRLQNFRFDNALALSVDFKNSTGVMGERYHQGSLYLSLAPEAEDIVIALKDNNNPGRLPDATQPYLIQSSWRINSLQISEYSLTFTALGLGVGHMHWQMPHPGEYSVEIEPPEGTGAAPAVQKISTRDDGALELHLDPTAGNQPLLVKINALK